MYFHSFRFVANYYLPSLCVSNAAPGGTIVLVGLAILAIVFIGIRIQGFDEKQSSFPKKS